MFYPKSFTVFAKLPELSTNQKNQYFTKIGKTPSNHKKGQKIYWSLIKKILNKVKIPLIPPFLENGIFVLDFKSKAQIVYDHFVLQCTTIDTGSEIPDQVCV